MPSCSLRLILLLSTAVVFTACSSSPVYEEKTTIVDGIASECGEGPGLAPCRDIDGNTYEQDANPDGYFSTEDNEQLEEDGERMRHEDPKEFEETTEELEEEQWSQ